MSILSVNRIYDTTEWASVKSLAAPAGQTYVRYDTGEFFVGDGSTAREDVVPIGRLNGDIVSGDYSQFEADGTLVAVGDATCWDDWTFALTPTRQGALSKPDFDFTNFGLLFPQNDADEIAYLIDQCPHKRKAGSNFHPHIHWRQTSTDAPTWKLEYRFLNNGQSSETAFTTITADAEVFAYDDSGGMIQISTFPTIDGSAVNISAMFEGRLYRDDNLITGDVLAKEFDIHIEIDMLGSRQEYVK